MIKIFTDQNFDQEVIKNEKIVLVDFWAPWCAPCLLMNPIIDKLAKDFEGRVDIGKINVDENKDVTKKYDIMSVPNIKIFQNGVVVKEFIGKQDAELMANELNNFFEDKSNNQEVIKDDTDKENKVDGCCSEKDYCTIDCAPDKGTDVETKPGCGCGGNC